MVQSTTGYRIQWLIVVPARPKEANLRKLSHLEALQHPCSLGCPLLGPNKAVNDPLLNSLYALHFESYLTTLDRRSLCMRWKHLKFRYRGYLHLGTQRRVQFCSYVVVDVAKARPWRPTLWRVPCNMNRTPKIRLDYSRLERRALSSGLLLRWQSRAGNACEH